MQAVLASLSSRWPRLLGEVGLLLDELGRITVTMEERWAALLAEVEADVARRAVGLQVRACVCSVRSPARHSPGGGPLCGVDAAGVRAPPAHLRPCGGT